MNGAHVTGGAIGAVLGAILAPLLARYGVTITDSTAALIGTAAVSLGVGLGHVVSTQGLWPALKRAFTGPSKPSALAVALSPAGFTEVERKSIVPIPLVTKPPAPVELPQQPPAPPAT